jgi:hypothetical protein
VRELHAEGLIISACSIGSADRLAMVRFLTRLPSRMLSRSRMAGGEPRFGTMSMYMGAVCLIRASAHLSHRVAYMGTHKAADAPRQRPSPCNIEALSIAPRYRAGETSD